MRHPRRWLGLIVIAALGLRLGLLLTVVDSPAIADSSHYYHMAINLADGRGFVIDYLWQYSRPADAITHPEDHWMPLTALVAALPLTAFATRTLDAALLGFVVLGAALPILVYALARQLDLRPSAALIAAGLAAFVPEFILNSLRTDTTLLAAFLTTLAVLSLLKGWTAVRVERQGLWYAIAGAAAGATYLTRSDGVLIVAAGSGAALIAVLASRGRRRPPLTALLFPAAFALVIAPWLIRNLQVFGQAGSPETADMFFFTDHLDHYAYGRDFTLETLLAAQSWGQILGKRAFELAAGGQMIIATADALALPLFGGLALLIARRDRRRLGGLLPALLLAVGVIIAYGVFIPYKAQAGSLKKGWLMALPALIPVAAYAFDAAIADRRLRVGAALIVGALLALNGVQITRTDQRAAGEYLRQIAPLVEIARGLPDRTGDGEIVLMTQDPYVFSLFGLRTVMFPHEPLAVVREVARRYGVDYLLFPAARPALDPLYVGALTDDRFALVEVVPGTPYQFWQVD